MATEECEELGMDSLVRDCDEVIGIIFDSKFDHKHPLEVLILQYLPCTRH